MRRLSIDKWNQNLNALVGLSDEMVATLFEGHRVMRTSLWIDALNFPLIYRYQAPLEFPAGWYIGHIVVSERENWEEAAEIAKKRGWGEFLHGWVEGIEPGENEFDIHRDLFLN